MLQKKTKKGKDGSLVNGAALLDRPNASAPSDVPAGDSTDTQVHVTSPERRKKKKRRKDAPGAEEHGPHIAGDALAGKKQKKRKALPQAAEQGSAIELPLSRATPAAQAPAAYAAPLQAGPLKQKRKADKHSQTDRAKERPTSRGLAAVGDADLAAAGPPLRKDLYIESAAVGAMTMASAAAWRATRHIDVQGCNLRPVTEFAHSGFSDELLQATREFVVPSPIQAQCWPILSSGRDLVGIAATGSGKTLAFGLPLLQHAAAHRGTAGTPAKGRAPRGLVLAPTRELAMQTAEVLASAGAPLGLKTLCVYGGVPRPPQVAALRKGMDVVVATPGRLEDLVADTACSLASVSMLVLDEADRMLDLGFEPAIRALAARTRADRQTAMFSATWPPAVVRLAGAFLAPQPARVTIGSPALSAAHSVTQIVEVMEPGERDRRLEQLLKKHHADRKTRVLVFVLYKKEAPRLEALLQRKGWHAAAVHGDIGQAMRTRAVQGFKDGSVPLLIATDVAARGLDIDDVQLVINYSFPLTVEDYVHRIGRTGRAGKTGLAITFFSAASDKGRAGELVNVLREAQQPVPPALAALGGTVKKKESKLYGAHFKELDHSVKATKTTFADSDSN